MDDRSSCRCAIVQCWQGLVLWLQTDAALRISGQCERLERSALSAEDPKVLALEIQWVQIYYGLNNGRVGSRLRAVVRRDYEHTMTNSFAALHRIATNNGSAKMSPWLTKWLEEHEH